MAMVFRLRADVLAERRKALGIETEQALADYIGMSQPSVNRVLRGVGQPGPQFVAALVGAFPGSTIDTFFEVVEEARAS